MASWLDAQLHEVTTCILSQTFTHPVRHVVAGFLVEYLQLDWRLGEKWFHDTLVDADVAINAYMWQVLLGMCKPCERMVLTVSGVQNGGHSGMDQWNFVMHPGARIPGLGMLKLIGRRAVYAAKNCDPEGEYCRWFVPELARLPVEYIHCPWEAPASVLAGAGVVLGRDYPKRVLVDLDGARQESLEAVLEVRHNNPEVILRSGHERLVLDNGNVAVLITRKDYHAKSVLTKMSAGELYLYACFESGFFMLDSDRL